jgi:hypothetical protein
LKFFDEESLVWDFVTGKDVVCFWLKNVNKGLKIEV